MSRNHRRVIAGIWLLIPPLLLSALIHSIDPDVGGVAGLALPANLLSVLIWGFPVLVFVLLCLLAAVRRGWGGFLVVSLVLAAAVAAPVALLQSPRPAGLIASALPLFGGTLTAWLFLAAAVVPALALGWSHAVRRSQANYFMDHIER